MLSKEGKMEKSFLNFKVRELPYFSRRVLCNLCFTLQAANPDWNPTDPSGSLYLSRMADFNATHAHTSPARRRIPGTGFDNTVTGTILRLGERKRELADRAQEYDRALRQSQHAAARRRHAGNSGTGSNMTGSNGSATGLAAGGAGSSIWKSDTGEIAMAQTAVLGDSHGSIGLVPPVDEPLSHGDEDIHHDDLASDGGVGSELGDSYVDGKRLKTYTSPQDYVEEDEGIEDGGVLGLLAQIYGTKGQGPARVI